jgi:hypothetical protein
MPRLKKDHPRRIDRIIDYFGERLPGLFGRASRRPSGDSFHLARPGALIARRPEQRQRRLAAQEGS